MKIPKQPSLDKNGCPDFKDRDMYRIPIICEENVPEVERYTRAPYIISQRLNRPRRSRCHSVKVAMKWMVKTIGRPRCFECGEVADFRCRGDGPQMPDRLKHEPHYCCSECDRGVGCRMVAGEKIDV